MPKQRPATSRAEVTRSNARANGLRYFMAGRFDQAIAAWQVLDADPQVRAALAEAYFRRSLTQPDDRRADDLRVALALLPDDPRFHYQLALLLHRQSDFVAAEEHYARVAATNPRWHGLARVRGLAAIERGILRDVAAGDGLSTGDLHFLRSVAALLHNDVPAANENDRVSQLWHGMGLLRSGATAAAFDVLAPTKTNRLSQYQLYYRGLAAAAIGDASGALAAWQQAFARGYCSPWMLHNVAAVRYSEIQRLVAEDKPLEAARLAQGGAQLATGNSALAVLEVETLDAAARAAVADDDWAAACHWWEAARIIMSQADGVGSPRPLLHNLALAYEAIERWMEAANAWRAMLRTRPRKTTPVTGDLSVQQWAWVRRRVIECYKRANAPGEAVAVFRQAIKADPADVDLRLELSDALLANDQPQAAFNEIQRVLERDPDHIEALLRMSGYQIANHMFYDADAALRRIAARNPERADQRESLAYLLSQLGSQYSEFSRYDDAYRVFAEAVRFAPEGYANHLNLARVAFNRKQVADARAHLAEALRLGADQPDAYVTALDCWAFEQDENEARAVIALAEGALPNVQEFYIEAGTNLLDGSDFDIAFGRRAKTTFADTFWTRLGQDLLDRALALRPNDAELHGQIASSLLQTRPDIGLRYAAEAVRLAPEDPHFLVLHGLLQALNGDKKAARTLLQKAARLARKQGNSEMAEHAEHLRTQINSPFFGLALQMGGLIDDEDDEWI